MSRLIDADAYIAEFEQMPMVQDAIRKSLEHMPTIEERKTGKWIKNSNGTYSCDKCHSWIPNEQHYYANFCLHCGAVMRGEEECTKKI